MEIKVKYWSNHGKAHYINFESFDDYIAKYKEDPKFGTFFASGICLLYTSPSPRDTR